MLVRAVAGIALAGMMLGSPARAEDVKSRVHGEILVGRDSADAEMIGDLNGINITVFQKDGGGCEMPYYVKATAYGVTPGKVQNLAGCLIYRCTHSKLKQKCKGQPDQFELPCQGSLDYEPSGIIRLEVSYFDEIWEAPKCGLRDKKASSTVILLRKPSQGGAGTTTTGDTVNCYLHNMLYPVKTHPMHKQCD